LNWDRPAGRRAVLTSLRPRGKTLKPEAVIPIKGVKMALMRSVGVFLYNVALFLTLLFLFLNFKNYNFEAPDSTADYSGTLELVIDFVLGAFIAFGIGMTVAVSLSKSRKKGFWFGILLGLFWIFMAVSALFIFLSPLLSDDVSTPGWKHGVAGISIALAFLPTLALLLLMFPGTFDREKIVEAVTKNLKKDDDEGLPFCPECKFRVKESWKYCPNCGSKFSD